MDKGRIIETNTPRDFSKIRAASERICSSIRFEAIHYAAAVAGTA
jgi:hypothetical protein